MNDYRVGDSVVLAHEDGSRLIRDVTEVGPAYVLVRGFENESWSLSVLAERGWRVTDHKPKIELPLEPGYYEDNYGDVWTQSTKGVWAMISDPYSALKPSEYAPFTRLVPEGSEREAAIREVLEWQKANSGTRAAEALITETLHRFVSSE